jgi:ubiquinone/menaquinone biosynthesis C-methylase UbiE
MVTQDKDKEVKFFDDFVVNNDYDVFDDHGYNRILKELYANLPEFNNKKGGAHFKRIKLLDMGCGTGVFTSKLQQTKFDLYGIDISSKSIDIATNKYQAINFSVGDIENTPFNDESFDIVLLSGVLHHFNDFNKVIGECYRLLTKGGMLFAYDPHCNNPIMWLYRCKSSPFYSSKGVTENEQPLHKDTIKEVLSRYPFIQYNIFSISGVTYKYVESKAAYVLIPAYNFIERIMDVKYLRDKIGSFVITVAIK